MDPEDAHYPAQLCGFGCTPFPPLHAGACHGDLEQLDLGSWHTSVDFGRPTPSQTLSTVTFCPVRKAVKHGGEWRNRRWATSRTGSVWAANPRRVETASSFCGPTRSSIGINVNGRGKFVGGIRVTASERCSSRRR